MFNICAFIRIRRLEQEEEEARDGLVFGGRYLR